jgi:hypothetical protein
MTYDELKLEYHTLPSVTPRNFNKILITAK